MCFMDWRIGRLIRSVSRQLACDASGFVTLQANQQRVGITAWWAADQTGIYVNPTSAGGLFSPAVAQFSPVPVHMTIATHGDLVMQTIRIQAGSASATTIMVTEYFAPEKVLQLGLEQIQNQYPL